MSSILYRPADRDNPFHVGGELQRKADLMLARSRITRSQLYIVDPDLTQSSSTTDEDDAELVVCRLRPHQRQRPASDCLLTDRLCSIPEWSWTANGDTSGGGKVKECRVERLDDDTVPAIGRAITVTVSPDYRKKPPCCSIS